MGISWLSSSYLPPDARERLLDFEYHGEDKSYLYKFMWRPLCRKAVQYLPVRLAPNIITVAALSVVALTHVLISYYMPSLAIECPQSHVASNTSLRGDGRPATAPSRVSPPAWVFVALALGLFLYQLLDNLDGHQARRTCTSSPLGLLMDHGCDAVNCVISGLSAAGAIAAGPGWKTWLLLLSPVVVFFMNTFEAYYRGTLVLPVINGPNEGIIIAIGMYLWTAWAGGPQWWACNAVEIPARWLPAVLRQPPPQAAVEVESRLLRAVCPYLTTVDVLDGTATIPFLLSVNCSSAYVARPPLPSRIAPAAAAAPGDLTKQWSGHGWVQKAVLRLYGAREGSVRVRYNSIFVLVATVLALITCAGNALQVYLAVRRVPAGELPFGRGWLARRLPFTHALTRLLPLLVLTVMANAWFIASKEDVFRRHPRLSSWTVGLLYTKLAIHLMLAHLCGTVFNPCRRTFIPFLILGSHLTLTYLHGVHQLKRRHRDAALRHGPSPTASLVEEVFEYGVNEELILYVFFGISLVTFVHLTWYVVREAAAALRVPIFVVPPEKQAALLRSLQRRQSEGQAAQLTKKRS